MAEAKSRREAPGPRTRPRSRSEYDSANGEEDSRAGEADTPTRDGVAAPPEEPRPQEPRTQEPRTQEPRPQEPRPQEPRPQEPRPQEPRPQEPRPQETRPQEKRNEDFGAFDDEINNRYEEIKRGSTHISELQQMTMPQLLKVAKDENLTDYTGLKKQDLIFKILKERVKQNGLMFGEGTLEVLPDGFGLRSCASRPSTTTIPICSRRKLSSTT